MVFMQLSCLETNDKVEGIHLFPFPGYYLEEI